MKSRLLAFVALTVGIVIADSAFAAEPYVEFVEALRQRGYYDYALLYLDQISAAPNTPENIKQIIPYQKAMVHQENAKTMRTPEKQIDQLNLAQAFLEQFVKASPNHPLAADANSDRAAIMLNKGQAENLQAKSPSNQGAKRDFQNRARDLVAGARKVFQTAFDQHEANFKKFPAFIDQGKDPDQYAARSKVEQNLITTSLSLGMCTYEEAQTYDAGSNDFKLLLGKAAEEFEKMHQKYRSQVGGLYARAWQGKCYEEQKELQRALGIYNELLDHPGDDRALQQLKTQTLYFKLICLNERKDYQLIVDLAEDWMKKHQTETRTRLGLGIQWEQAKAFEALGDDRNNIKQDQERFWKQARTAAQTIQKFPSEYKDVATSMAQRVTVKLGGKDKPPDKFDEAFGLGRLSFSNSQDLYKELEDARKRKPPAPEEVTKLTLDRTNELNDAARYFELALNLVKPNDDKKSVLTCRLLYAYTNFYLRKNYEAAVLAQFVARTADKDDGTTGLDAAYIAMAAFVQAYNDNKAPNDQKGEDMRLIIKASNLIAERWPSSDKANDAYMMLGRMNSKNPAEAAGWFTKVPETDPKYPDAQLAAGQAYWTAYLNSNRLVGADKPTAEQLATWLQSSQDHLRRGIQKLAATLPKEGAAPGELIAAKMSLAQIMISQGKDADALKLLMDDPQSVLKAITVADEKQRPEAGVTSRKFATETYKLVLRAYIGTGNLEKARETMRKLEEIAAAGGAEGGAEVTELYVGLGKLLRDELERFRNAGETERFDKLMTSFETFLNDMAGRKDGQTFGTLSWIGETYFALGEAVSSDSAKANVFFDKAGGAFADILKKVAEDQNFAQPAQVNGVKMRQIRVMRLKKEFAEAETLMTGILNENANNLKIQTAAAELYQDWGSSGQANSAKKLIVAIQGTTKVGGKAWGWRQISTKLQHSPEFNTNPAFMESFLDARYHGTDCHFRYGKEQPAKEKQKHLEECLRELVITMTVTKDIPDEWYQKFNALYRDVLTAAGQPVEDLPRTKDVPVQAPVKPEPEKPKEAEPGTAVAGPDGKGATPPPPPGIDMMTWIIFISCIVLGLGAIGYVLLRGKSKPKAKEYGASLPSEAVSFTGINIGDAAPPATFAAPKPKPRPAATGTATATKPATKPAAKPSAGPGGAPPKPKPKPPGPAS